MKTKPIQRVNPELNSIIEEAKREAMKSYNINNAPWGMNQIAQTKVAEWARIGKTVEQTRKNSRLDDPFARMMDKLCEPIKKNEK